MLKYVLFNGKKCFPTLKLICVTCLFQNNMVWVTTARTFSSLQRCLFLNTLRTTQTNQLQKIKVTLSSQFPQSAFFTTLRGNFALTAAPSRPQKLALPATFQMLKSHTWLVVTTVPSADTEYCRHHREHRWTVLVLKRK